jgi:hypothetical protein
VDLRRGMVVTGDVIYRDDMCWTTKEETLDCVGQKHPC